MFNFSVIAVLFDNDIESYKIFGEYNEIHHKLSEIIVAKNLTHSDNPELAIIYNESYVFYNYFWRNTLSEKTKWLIVKLKDTSLMERAYRETRFFGEDAIWLGDVFVIKNIVSNFKTLYNHNFSWPKSYPELSLFFNLYPEKSSFDVKKIHETNEEIRIIKIITSNNDYVYFGEPMDTNSFDRCCLFLGMSFNIIECVDLHSEQTKGYFCHKNQVKDFLLYLSYKYKTLENLLKFNEKKITVPINHL